MKYYDISVLYHPSKANVVVDALSELSMGSVSYVKEAKRNLMKDYNRLPYLGVQIEDSRNDGMVVFYLKS